MSEFDKWKQVAHMFGESLAPVGPDGYYSFSPDQWLKWAKDQIRADEIARLHAENAALRAAVERVRAACENDLRWVDAQPILRALEVERE